MTPSSISSTPSPKAWPARWITSPEPDHRGLRDDMRELRIAVDLEHRESAE
jgi:hypothetical protein